MNPNGYEAALNRLNATLRRQQEAMQATKAQIELFQDLLLKARQGQLELEAKSVPKAR